MKKCLAIGISGPTTAGKTTISQLFRDNFDCPVIHQDSFFNYERVYKQLNGNREIPEAIDSIRLVEEVKKAINTLKEGYLIVEGFQLYHYKQLCQLLDVKIFLDIPDEVIHERRMKTNKCSQEYFNDMILKNYHRYKEVIKTVPDLHILDSTKKIAEVYKEALKIVNNR